MSQVEWQKFYTIMESNDFNSFGIDIQETLSNTIRQRDFARVLKMDCGSGYEKYVKIYLNQKWQFLFISRRMASPIIYEVKVTDQLSSEVYDFSNPNENRDVLDRWLSFFIKCCTKEGIIIKHNQWNNITMDLTIKHGVLDLSKKNLSDLSILKYVTNPFECKELKLNENKISVIKNLEKFENLEILNLGNNFITKINGLEDLRKIKELSLYTNQIEVIENLDSLENLEKLNIDYNLITEILGLENLEKLEVLSMNNNKIAIISNLNSLHSLKELNLDENPVHDITSIGNLTNLITLRMQHNDLPPNLLITFGINRSDSVVPDIERVKTYARGEFVLINDEYILAFKSHEFEYGYESLGLHLGDKNIDDIKSIQNLTKINGLKALIIWNNNIKDIDGLKKLKDLEFLYLSNNDITNIKGLDSLKNLKVLKINNNQITKIENLHNLAELRRLELSNNEIKEINSLDPLKNLVILDLSNNKISEICNLDNLEQLEQLLLQNNQISEIKELNSLKKLKELNLSSNQIGTIKGIESLVNLQSLDLSHNFINEIRGFETNKKISNLDLSNNKINKFCELKHIINLYKLNLDNNDLIIDTIQKIKEFSSDETFAKNIVGFCILKELITNISDQQEEIIKFEDSDVYHQLFRKIKYPKIQLILKLLTDQYFEFQMGRNDFTCSIFTPIYAANKLTKILKEIDPEGSHSFVDYEELMDKLKLRNVECTEKLIEYIQRHKLCKIPFNPRVINKVKGIVRKKGNNIKDIIENIFWKPAVELSETRVFRDEPGLHTRLLENIKTQLKKYQIIEIHNMYDEISIDLLLKCKKYNWKIGISVEATSDIVEIKKDKRNVSFPKTINAKMTDIDRLKNLDLFLILFCIDLTVKSYHDTLRITVANLEKIDDPKVAYIPPENLVDFFKDTNFNNEK